ncbi:MAG: hypothetical protein GWP08_05900 [Nitrospiraceae bacterium]|nr:hypothetical protein [Nitrospiraceae bacterium]
MTEERMLVCTCGRTLRVPAAAVGATFVCAGCSASIECTEANTRPLTQAERDVGLFANDEEELAPPPSPSQAASPSPPPPTPSAPPATAASMPSSPAPPADATTCPSCGRTFRGDWDRVDVAGKTVCDICARSVKQLDKGVRPTEPPQPKELSETAKALRAPSWGLQGVEEQSKKILTDEDRRRRRFEMMILGIAGAVVLAVVYFWPESEKAARSGAGAAENLPGYASTIGWIVEWSLRLAATELTIYLMLRAIDQLANNRLWADLLVICPVAVLVTAVSPVPIGGHLIGLILVYMIYDLPGAGLLYYLVFRLVTGFLCWALSQLVVGTVVQLLT